MFTNTKTLLWNKESSEESNHRPTSREGHIFIYMPDKNKYLLFAGVSHQRFSDIFILDATNLQWTNIESSGKNPKEISHFVGWYEEPHLFIHGGRNKNVALGDTYFLDTDKWIWKKVFTMEQPSSRYMHAVAKTDNKEAYIFGGFDEKRNRYLGDLHKYDYKNLKFTSTDNERIAGSSWNKVTDSGTIPKGRKGHSMVYYKSKIILYGGQSEKGLEDENFYEFSIETRIWKILEITGMYPLPRVFFSMNFISDDEIFIFGGKVKSDKSETDSIVTNEYFILDLTTNNISAPFIANVAPSSRFGHSSSYNINKDPIQHIIIGGLDQAYCSFDIYTITQLTMGFNKKWVNEQKKMHSNQSVNYENKDDIYETAKKTIINYKKQIELLGSQIIDVNRRYSDHFNILSQYKRNLLEEDLSTNEKRTQQKKKKIEIENEKRELLHKIKEHREYNNFLNNQLKIKREKYLLLSQYLDENLGDIKEMDEFICAIDKTPNKCVVFTSVDVDALSFKRKNYKNDLENFKKFLTDSSMLEKEIYDEILKLQNEQNEKFKNEYFSPQDKKHLLSLKETDLLNDSLEDLEFS